MTVSIAHEMLHAAYQQLDGKERRSLNAELERVYQSLADPQLTELVDSYRVSEPRAHHNELHSLLATQVATLSPRLERYYRRWFRDRQQVVAAFQSYNTVLTDLERRHDELQAQVDSLQAQLTDLESRVLVASQRSRDLSGQINSLREQGRIEESNELVPAQNAAAAETNDLVAQGRDLLGQYDALLGEYNRLVDSAHEIYDSITARPDDTPGF
jgi:chromosome segregation ATPase